MTWLKKAWATIAGSTIVLVLLAALGAALAAQSRKKARQWQDKSVDIEAGNVVKGIDSAKAANTQAKLHEAKADARKAKAEARIKKLGSQNEEMATILDNFRKSS